MDSADYTPRWSILINAVHLYDKAETFWSLFGVEAKRCYAKRLLQDSASREYNTTLEFAKERRPRHASPNSHEQPHRRLVSSRRGPQQRRPEQRRPAAISLGAGIEASVIELRKWPHWEVVTRAVTVRCCSRLQVGVFSSTVVNFLNSAYMTLQWDSLSSSM